MHCLLYYPHCQALPSPLFFVGVRGEPGNEATVVLLLFVWRKYSKLVFRHTECAHICVCVCFYMMLWTVQQLSTIGMTAMIEEPCKLVLG